MKSSKSIIEPYLKRTDWRTKENSNSPECYGGMNKYICGEVSKDYWLREVYTEDIAQAYVNGYVHIHDLGGLTLYTYFGKETIIIKDPNGKIQLTSFEMLYNSLIENEVCVDASRGVFCIYIKGYQVLDKDGWTQITRLTRKEKHRDMKFIKNEQGRSVIVTDNHPMLTKAVGDDDITTKESKDVLEEDDYLYSADIQKLLKDETLFYKDSLDLCEIMPQTVGRKTVYFNGFDRKLLNNYDNVKYVNTISDRLPRYIKLDSEFGFLVGFIIAEGSFTKDSTIGAISLVNKNYDDLMRCCNALDNIGCPYSVTFDENREMYSLYIGNSLFSYILRVVFNILPYSKNKTLPIDILTYSKGFVKGVISGVIDGDGNSNNTQVTIRTASRTLMEQIATLLPFIGLFGRDRAIEGQGIEHIFDGKIIHQNYPLYGVSFRKKELDCLCSRKYDETTVSKSNWRTEELDNWSKVLNLKDVNIPDEYIYDITTESHTLLVNGMYNHNCCGYSLRDILLKGVRGVQNIPTSAPAKHFDSVLNQIGNLLTVFQNEIMGAVALNSFDTLLAPFIKSDNLTYSQVKQNMQNFIYSINSNSRMGAEPAFSNLTFDLTPPQDLLDEYVIIGGELASFTYRSCQQEMDMLNRAFFEIMLEGDSEHKLFAYPIPTYNIHKRFDWDNPNNRLLWELAGKYGTPYFANYLNSDMNPEDARSMCCRLRLDLTELRKRNGGLFGSGDSTGSIGVVTINLPRIAYESQNDKEQFYKKLDYYLNIAKDSLVIKRKWLQENILDKNQIPAFMEYVGTMNNHFSTIGIVGMNEMCENFFDDHSNILSEKGKAFAEEVGAYIRNKLVKFQEETGSLFNYEATPAESTCYRLALADKKVHEDIITQGSGKDCYYTNSCHIPVKYIEGLDSTFKHQETLQSQFTGGTVIHLYMEGAISGEQAKSIIKSTFTNYTVPYVSISPISRYCEDHGYIEEHVDKCPICKKRLKKYQRITGYLRCIDNFNRGKRAEFEDRKQLNVAENNN